jgi:tryptophan synthase beta subunit
MNMSKRTILRTAPGGFGSIYTLEHRTAGTEIAGSGTRETVEHWASIRTGKTGAVSGQRFKTLQEAEESFRQFTTPIIEVLK